MSALTRPVDLEFSTSTSVLSGQLATSVTRILALTALFSAAAVYEASHLLALFNSDVWLHLRTGVWILDHRLVPHTGLFSQYSHLSWNDASWAFDAILGALYKLRGLRAIPAALMMLKVAWAAGTFFLARAGRASFWTAFFLSAVAQYVTSGVQPDPAVLSMVFFAIELGLLVRYRRSGSIENLYALPLLFALWANLHIGFAIGLLLLALFLISILLEQTLRSLSNGWASEGWVGEGWMSGWAQPTSLRRVGWISGLSLLATLANPYTFRLLPSAFGILYSSVGFEHFSELSAMSFRRPQDYALMLLVMLAFLALGRQRSLASFEMMTLLAGALIAFRVQRDAWLAVLPAIAVLSESLGGERTSGSEKDLGRHRMAWATGLSFAILVVAIGFLPRSDVLMNKVNNVFPLKACNYMVENHLPPPLFHAYSWAGFLAWYVPQYPVVVDSRIGLYGDDALSSYFDLIGGKTLLESDPRVAHAGTLLLERESAMAKALRNLPALSSQYRLVYSDDVASVFVPQRRQ